MNEKKEEYSTKAGIILIINAVLYVVWAASGHAGRVGHIYQVLFQPRCQAP